MDRYTFVLEFEGGTYISQTSAANVDAAFNTWCEETQRKNFFAHRTTRFLKAMQKQTPASKIALVSGVDGVWCLSCIFAGNLVLMHIALTQPTS